jgi:DNA-binding NarL/FixJ family response regulator
MTITVLLVDDHALIREGLRRAFEQTDDIEVVAEASSVSAALALDRAHTPDVLVVDVNLGDGSGIDVVRHVRTQRPTAGLVVLTMYDGDAHLLAALEAGASAFVLKQAPADEVVAAAIRAATSPTAFTADGLSAAMRRKFAPPAARLTARESEILALLVSGLSVSEVSGRLYVSPSTTKTHMARLYEKLGATNRTQAVMNAVRLGLVAVDTDCQ